MERWYHHGVVVLWPQDRYFRILAGEGQAAALPALAELVESDPEPASSEACHAFAQAIIDLWQPSVYPSRRESDSHAASMLTQLARIGDTALATQFIRLNLVRDYNDTEGQPLSALCHKLGYPALADALQHFITSQVPTDRRASLTATVSIFEALCCSPEPLAAARKATCRALAGDLEEVMQQWDAHVEAHACTDFASARTVDSICTGKSTHTAVTWTT